MTKRVLLLMSPATYRVGAFLGAAERLGLESVQGTDVPKELADAWQVPLKLDFGRPAQAVAAIVDYARERPLDAVLSVDDSASLIAAEAAAALGLPHNDPGAALAARDKWRMRELLAAGGVASPPFRALRPGDDPLPAARAIGFPVVVKPTRLNGSRGVIRADDSAELAAAFARTRRLLEAEGLAPAAQTILIEEFIPGFEVALEGLLTDGRLTTLALFDKPDPLDGPLFEETIYVTPSRLPAVTQRAIADCTAAAAAALGLRTGPVHAELRVNARAAWLVEIAGRSIGGLCSTILQFGAGMSLEELILRHAVGLPLESTQRHGQAAGVMMIPIPRGGLLRGWTGEAEALAVPGVTGLEITAKVRHPIVPLPEGASYLGFIFARGEQPAEVEAALRQAHACLRFDIQPVIPLRDRRGSPSRLTPLPGLGEGRVPAGRVR